MPNLYLAKLQNFYSHQHRLPSYQEMLGLFKLKSKNSIHKIIQKLIAAEFVKKDAENKLIPTEKLSGVKILGQITAGFPSAAEEELVDAISLDKYLIHNQAATFLLRVSGNSMLNAGICPGDLVLVERGRSVRPNDIVIAQVDEAWTLKRYLKTSQGICLMPENPKFKPIYPKQELNIAGVVIAVVRKYH